MLRNLALAFLVVAAAFSASLSILLYNANSVALDYSFYEARLSERNVFPTIRDAIAQVILQQIDLQAGSVAPVSDALKTAADKAISPQLVHDAGLALLKSLLSYLKGETASLNLKQAGQAWADAGMVFDQSLQEQGIPKEISQPLSQELFSQAVLNSPVLFPPEVEQAKQSVGLSLALVPVLAVLALVFLALIGFAARENKWKLALAGLAFSLAGLLGIGGGLLVGSFENMPVSQSPDFVMVLLAVAADVASEVARRTELCGAVLLVAGVVVSCVGLFVVRPPVGGQSGRK